MLLVAYDPSISADATKAVRVKAECTWSAKLEHQHLILTVEHQLHTFFSTIIVET